MSAPGTTDWPWARCGWVVWCLALSFTVAFSCITFSRNRTEFGRKKGLPSGGWPVEPTESRFELSSGPRNAASEAFSWKDQWEKRMSYTWPTGIHPAEGGFLAWGACTLQRLSAAPRNQLRLRVCLVGDLLGTLGACKEAGSSWLSLIPTDLSWSHWAQHKSPCGQQ